MQHNYFVYIVTNFNRSTIYTGVTNDLKRRIFEHYNELFPGFTKNYKCKYLVFFERFQFIDHAITREKQIKSWRREKKDKLINGLNPDWNFLNDEIEGW